MKPSIVSGFGVAPENVVVTGDPRDDVLLAGDEADAPRRRHGRGSTRPCRTCRRRPASCCSRPRGATAGPTRPFPRPTEWDAIVAWLEQHDAVLLVRTHPLGRGSYADGPARSERIRLLGPDLLRDVNPVLWAVDAVITDYSSIVFDFALVGRPVVFFAPDLADYASIARLLPAVRRVHRRPGRHHMGRCARAARRGARARTRTGRPTATPGTCARSSSTSSTAAPASGCSTRSSPGPACRAATGTSTTAIGRPKVTGVSYDPDTAALSIDGPDGRCPGRPTGPGRGGRTDRSPCSPPAGGSSRWPCRPTPTGCVLADGSTRVDVIGGAARDPPRALPRDRARARRRPRRRGRPSARRRRARAAAQKALERAYRRGSPEVEDAVFLESFRGRSAACNPRGIEPRPRRDAAVDASLLERRRRVGAGSRRVGAADRGQPRVVARPRVGPRPGRQRLAAQALPQAPPPARPADVARLDAQAAGPRPSGRRPAHAGSRPPARAGAGTPCSPRTTSAPSTWPRPTRSAGRCGSRATRATTSSPEPDAGRRRSARRLGHRRRHTHRALRPHLARGPHVDGRPPRRGRVRPSPRARPRAPRARPQQHLGARHATTPRPA